MRINFDEPPTAEELADVLAVPLNTGQVEMVRMAVQAMIIDLRDQRGTPFFDRATSLLRYLDSYIPPANRPPRDAW